jgi:glycerol-3-phosphate acyltransferase PlsY
MHPLVGVLGAYLLGSIPSAYIAGRALKGIDLRQHGSGNLGATNVYRVLGAGAAIAVLLFDAAKGALPVWLFPRMLLTPGSALSHVGLAWAIAYGLSAIAGHVRPIFLRGKGGGKGVATAAGVFLALAPLPMGVALAVWITVVLVTGYVSAASLAAAVALPVALAVVRGPTSPLTLVAVGVALFVFWTHRANIGRLRRGEEPRFGRKPAT